jgi:flagellar protein FlbD
VFLVTRLNGSQFYVNAELVRYVEGTPDTVITLIDGVKLVVRERPAEVVNRIVAYRQQANAQPTAGQLQGEA